MANMLTNRHDIEQSISDEMFDDAIKFGQLAGTRDAPLTASTYGQAAMQGRAIGGLLGGQDPRMAKQDLIDELMAKHQNPSTKKELLAVAEDAATLGLYDIQGQFLDIASQVPDKKMATAENISSLTGILSLTQGSDAMIDSYLSTLEGYDDLEPSDKNSAHTKTKAQFDLIINGYKQWLSGRELTPADIDNMMFTSDGQLKNISMFKMYLGSISADATGNPFAAWLFNQNKILIANGNQPDKNTTLKIQNVIKEMPNDGEFISSTYNSTVDVLEVGKNDFENLSNNDKSTASMDAKGEMFAILQEVWWSMAQWGGGVLGEENMTPTDLQDENQDDEIQDWLSGAVPLFGTAYSPAMKHFLGLPPARLEEFQKDPEAYYRKYILKDKYYTSTEKDGVITYGDLNVDTSPEVISLWGLGN